MSIESVDIERCRQDARQLKRSTALSHCQALDQVARSKGYAHWKDLLSKSGAEPHVGDDFSDIVMPLAIPKSHGDEFHRVKIEGVVFAGVVSADGPYINVICPPARYGHGVALGVCRIVDLPESDQPWRHDGNAGWWLVKYDNERRSDLTMLTERGRKALASEFGIVLSRSSEWWIDPDDGERAEMFFSSPAFGGLCAWVKSRPRKAKEWARYQEYIRGWYRRAIEANG